ncbi:FAD-dependent oxidoreductase [Pediococcus pentosaceus]
MEGFRRIDNAEIKQLFNFIQTENNGVLVEGGARIDGQKFVEFLNQRNQTKFELRNERAVLSKNGTDTLVNGEKFDLIVLAVGAWLKDTFKRYWHRSLNSSSKGAVN